MPVEFLSDEQARRWGCFSGEPTREQLDGHFFLDGRDRKLARERRADHNRLGFGVQLGTVRFLGTFLRDPAEVPAVVASYIARQLDVSDPRILARYADRPNTFREHPLEIRREYGYKDYSDPVERLGLLRFIYARAWLRPDGPSVLFDLATARLAERKVLLPGVTTLAREVARVRERAGHRLWATIARAPDAVRRGALLALLELPEGSRSSELDRLRKGPTSVTAAGLVGALERLEEVRALGAGGVEVATVPANRLEALARYGMAAKAQQLSQMGEGRRVATLLATAQRLEADAADDALEVLDALMKKTASRVDGRREGAREGLARPGRGRARPARGAPGGDRRRARDRGRFARRRVQDRPEGAHTGRGRGGRGPRPPGRGREGRGPDAPLLDGAQVRAQAALLRPARGHPGRGTDPPGVEGARADRRPQARPRRRGAPGRGDGLVATARDRRRRHARPAGLHAVGAGVALRCSPQAGGLRPWERSLLRPAGQAALGGGLGAPAQGRVRRPRPLAGPVRHALRFGQGARRRLPGRGRGPRAQRATPRGPGRGQEGRPGEAGGGRGAGGVREPQSPARRSGGPPAQGGPSRAPHGGRRVDGLRLRVLPPRRGEGVPPGAPEERDRGAHRGDHQRRPRAGNGRAPGRRRSPVPGSPTSTRTT